MASKLAMGSATLPSTIAPPGSMGQFQRYSQTPLRRVRIRSRTTAERIAPTRPTLNNPSTSNASRCRHGPEVPSSAPPTSRTPIDARRRMERNARLPPYERPALSPKIPLPRTHTQRPWRTSRKTRSCRSRTDPARCSAIYPLRSLCPGLPMVPMPHG
jgi:hypothetical protein